MPYSQPFLFKVMDSAYRRLISTVLSPGIQTRRGGYRALRTLRGLKRFVRVEVPGGSVFIDLLEYNENDRQLMLGKGEREPHLQKIFEVFIGPNDLVLDIGANIGVHSVFLSSIAKTVYAVEPSPRLRACLGRTVAGLSNVRLLTCALSDFSGTAKFDTSGDHTGGGLGVDGEIVAVSTVDEIVGDQPISFMKIDVEGHEARVLAGSRALIQKHSPAIVFEQLAPNGHAAADFLREMGYSLTVISRTGELHQWSDTFEWCDVLAIPRDHALLSRFSVSVTDGLADRSKE